jgi:hypothetical protein
MGHLAPNAATQTYMQEDPGPYTTAANSAAVSFTTVVGCDLLVTVEADFSCVNSSGAPALMKGLLSIRKDGTNYASRFVTQTIGAGLSIAYPITISYRFAAVPASTLVGISTVYSDHASSALSGTVSNLRTRVEEIRR